MLNTPFSPWPDYSAEEADKAKEIILSNKVNYWTGTECREFEKEFASFTDSSYAVAVANGTLALDLAFKALNIGKGDEVIVTSRTFIASVSCIVNCGAKPVFVDLDSNSQNICPEAVGKAITPATKAIVCVHLAGWPCDMDALLCLAERYNLYLVEDCAQAHGAQYKGKSVGSIGHIGCWSFCQDKIMTTGGEGGAVTTNDELLWKKMWAYKDHGKSFDAVYHKKHPPGFRWLHESFGTNWRMTEVQAGIGRIQLQRMPEWTEKRNQYQNAIWNTAKKIKALRVPDFKQASGNIHAAYKCYVFVDPQYLKEGWNRDRIIAAIVENGVPCFSGSCSEVYLEKAFNGTGLRPTQELTVAKELGETSLMFLVHPTLKSDEVELSCEVIKSVFDHAALA